MSDEAQEKPKIIVDDDWKSRAQEEKEQLEKQQQEARDAGVEAPDLPPATLETLISTRATQAMASLGRLPNPIDGKPVKRLDVAKHHIDMLGVLEEKTQGNLTDEESAMISSVLHGLRMDYVAGGYHPPPDEPKAESPIITPGDS